MNISNTLKNQIYIGYDAREHDAWKVCDYSLRQFGLKPKTLKTKDIPLYSRSVYEPQSTDFTFSRFWIPYLCDYKGFSMFVDCDFVFLKDPMNMINEIAETKAVSVVKHPRYLPRSTIKMDDINQNIYDRKNWSSLIIFNNEHPKIKRLEPNYLINHYPGLDLHQFRWLEDSDIGSLSLTWNVLDGYYEFRYEEIGAIHYTDGGPWFDKYKKTYYSDIWLNKQKEVTMEKKEYPTGWECPRCGSVNAPQKEKCKCVKTESSEQDNKQYLTE